MARRILILIIISPSLAFCLQDKESGLYAGPSRAPLAIVDAAGDEGDDFLCGECPSPEPGNGGGRDHGALLPAVAAPETAAGRGGRDVSRRHGLGPVLSSLSDSLILGRPPPAAPANS